ncbi:hypothetical protein GCM10010501_45650 [Streptomyces libani subsp. rufus]|nr:hypothetical protein GCM10010501_45650 [Streptomyces libani subsp. rufus]
MPAMGASTTGGVTACGPMESGWVIVRAPERVDGTGTRNKVPLSLTRPAARPEHMPEHMYDSLVRRTIDSGVRWEPCQS